MTRPATYHDWVCSDAKCDFGYHSDRGIDGASHKHPVSLTTAKDVAMRPGAIRWDAHRCRWVRADTGGYITRSAQLSLEEAS